MQVIITGARGFVGKNLCAFLENRGDEIIRISRNGSPSYQSLFSNEIQGDIYVHLAGLAHDVSGKTHVESDYEEVNVNLTKKVFASFLADPTSKLFIFFSSVKALADASNSPLEESTFGEITGPYGASKRKAETYLIKQKLPDGKSLIIIRPAMIHGAGNKGNLNLLYKFVNKGLPYPFASFNNQRSFLSIANLLFVLDRIMAKSNEGIHIFNLADDGALSTTDLIRLIAKTAGKKPRLWKIPAALIRFGFAIFDRIPGSPINFKTLEKLTGSYLVSNKKVKEYIAVNKLPVSIEDGIISTLKSFG